MQRVAILGLGIMGGGMAANWLAKGFEEFVLRQDVDDFAAGPDDLDRPIVGGRGPELQFDPPVALTFRREGVRLLGADFDPVDQQRVALYPLGVGEGGDGGDDEQREDDGGRVSLPAGHCPRRRLPTRWPRPKPPRLR